MDNSYIVAEGTKEGVKDPEHTSLLNLHIQHISFAQLLEQLHEGILFTPNVDHLVHLQKDGDFYEAYQQAGWVVCDSVILQRCSRLLRHSIVESIPGSTFFHEYCNYHREDKTCRIFIMGGKEGVPQQAQENINRRIGRQLVVGAHSPSFSFVRDEEESCRLVEMVNRSEASVLVVCATSPKQEVWIARYRHRMSAVRLFMALGATVDFEAGNVRRCPVPFRHLGMEWFWRFCQEPARLFRRYFIDDPKFFWYFGKQLLGLYKNPFAK